MYSCITLDNLITYLKELQDDGKGNYAIYIGDSLMDDRQILYNDNKNIVRFENV